MSLEYLASHRSGHSLPVLLTQPITRPFVHPSTRYVATKHVPQLPLLEPVKMTAPAAWQAMPSRRGGLPVIDVETASRNLPTHDILARQDELMHNLDALRHARSSWLGALRDASERVSPRVYLYTVSGGVSYVHPIDYPIVAYPIVYVSYHVV